MEYSVVKVKLFFFLVKVEVEEEKEEVVVKEKEMKKSKSWGRRSTRAKKYISYRYVNLSARFT